MLKIVNAQEMQQIDRITIEHYGIAGTLLMERAGLSVVAQINKLFPERKVFVLCGGGNNGGDGLVIARVLHNQGRDVEVLLTVSPDTLRGDARINYNAAKKFGVKIKAFKGFLTRSSSHPGGTCLIVDALLGTGLNKEVRRPLSDIIGKVNAKSFPVISVDIPSGISSDTGKVMGTAVKATCTVTFGLPKRGHFLSPGAEYTGKLSVEEIGFPRALLESEKIRLHLLQKEDIHYLLPVRPRYSHKGTYGHVLIVAGSKGKTGAALMAVRACLRTGAGLVTLGVPDTLMNAFQSRVTEEMILPLPDKGNGTLSGDALGSILDFLQRRANVLAIGPGLSLDTELSYLVRSLVIKSRVPMVIDADGLNAIAGKTNVLKKSRAPIILTPHPGEMARLLGTADGRRQRPPKETGYLIEKDRIGTALAFARITKTCLVLKGVPTVISAPDGTSFINATGNPGMATAGTGDVLTGMISALLAQGLSPLNASALGAYMHGSVGDIAAEKKGERSLTASDLISAIPGYMKSL